MTHTFLEFLKKFCRIWQKIRARERESKIVSISNAQPAEQLSWPAEHSEDALAAHLGLRSSLWKLRGSFGKKI